MNFTTRRQSKTEEQNKVKKKLYDKYTTKDVEEMVFTDEQEVTVEITCNRQNYRVYGRRKKDTLVKRLRH